MRRFVTLAAICAAVVFAAPAIHGQARNAKAPALSGRFAEDAYRGEKQTRWAGPLRENQWFAVAAVVISVATTVLPSEIPAGPDYGVAPLLLLAMVVGGLATAFTMSMDFPKSTLRYSRLSG